MNSLKKYRPYLPLLTPLGLGFLIAAGILAIELPRDRAALGETPSIVATSSASATATPEATPTLDATSTATPAATATSTDTPELDPLYPPLTVGDPIELPEGVTLFVWDGCTECDVPHDALVRVRRADDRIESTVVRESSDKRYLLNGWVEDGLVYVFECSSGYCGGVSERSDDAAVTLHRSWTEGDEWESLGERPVDPSLPYPDLDPSDWGIDRQGGGRVDNDDAADGIIDFQGVMLDLRALDDRGAVDGSQDAYYSSGEVTASAEGRLSLRWAPNYPSDRDPNYLSVFEANGGHVMTYEVWSSGSWLNEQQVIATVIYQPGTLYEFKDLHYGWLPSIIDIPDGTVRPIANPFESIFTRRNLVMGVIVE